MAGEPGSSRPLDAETEASLPSARAQLEQILARSKTLALQRFPESREALEAFFAMAALLSEGAWAPSMSDEARRPAAEEAPEAEDDLDEDEDDLDEDEDDLDEDEEDSPMETRAELLAHLEQLEELVEALHKT